MWVVIEKFWERIAQNTLFVALVSGLVLAVLVTLITGFLAGVYQWMPKTPYVFVKDPVAATGIFLVCFFTFGLLIYFQSFKEGTDYFTPLRKRLVGFWQMEYETFDYEQDGSLKGILMSNAAIVQIDETTHKLFLRIKILETDIYNECDLRTDDVTINTQLFPKRMTYYHDLRIQLKDSAKIKMSNRDSEMRAPILVVLDINEDPQVDAINNLSGTWYDLNGAFASLIEEFAKASNIATTERVPTRGEIRFERVSAK
jgi:hypothetical protein